jgi:ATP-binding protein involved in chromosome partitioning
MHDPRISIIEGRLKRIGKVIAVSSGKGGVGKSLFASALALALTKKGYRTGLFDIDFTSPTTHVVLGAANLNPMEDKGLVPPEIHGLKYMSLVFYVGNRAIPLRGADLSNVLVEMLATTLWGDLDFLVIDMPPGMSDLLLDVIKYVSKAQFIVVTTPSKMAFETVRRLLNLLRDLKISILGVIENMKMNESNYIKREVKSLGEKFLGEIHFDSGLEKALGDIKSLLKTSFMYELEEIILAKNPEITS